MDGQTGIISAAIILLAIVLFLYLAARENQRKERRRPKARQQKKQQKPIVLDRIATTAHRYGVDHRAYHVAAQKHANAFWLCFALALALGFLVHWILGTLFGLGALYFGFWSVLATSTAHKVKWLETRRNGPRSRG
jgi:Flp pilus assembly protein TadB